MNVDLDALRALKRAAEADKFEAFEALRERERVIAATFKDPYGRDNHAYARAKAEDAEAVRLLAAFNAARDAFHQAGRDLRAAIDFLKDK